MSRTVFLIILGVVLFVIAGVVATIALLAGPSYFTISERSTIPVTPVTVLETTTAVTNSPATATPVPTALPTLPSVEQTDDTPNTDTIVPTDDGVPAEELENSQLPQVEECPSITNGTQRLRNPRQGYCLLYPAEYKVEKLTTNETLLVIGGQLNHSDPRVSIQVTPADTRSASEIADQIVAEFDIDNGIERSEIALDGETAVLLDGLLGQNQYRQIIAVHTGQVFTLTFSPLNPDASAQLETLYAQIVDSFTFTPPVIAEFEDCLLSTEQTQLLRQEEHGYCLLLPAQYQFEQSNEDETAFYIESPLNSQQPRLFIEVAAADEKTATEVADNLIAELGPGVDVMRTFGLTVGYEVAERLDNIPGQDVHRVVLVVHNGRLYKLTFVPGGEEASGTQEEMEALYDLVVKSFRFLP